MGRDRSIKVVALITRLQVSATQGTMVLVGVIIGVWIVIGVALRGEVVCVYVQGMGPQVGITILLLGQLRVGQVFSLFRVS